MAFDSNGRVAVLAALMAALGAGCGGGGGSASPPAVPVAITAQPQSLSVQTDGSATFSVAYSGAATQVQWARNGVAIAGATGSSYTLPAAGPADHGAQFTATVTHAGGSLVSQAATLTLVASANQQAFERLAVAPGGGAAVLHWNLNLTGGQTSGTNHLYEDRFVLDRSPLTAGPLTAAQSVPRNLARTLVLPADRPTRALVDGTVLLVPTYQGASRVSYVQGDVRVDTLAADGRTVAWSQRRSDYRVVDLAGALSAAPAELRDWHNSVFANPAVLAAGATWRTGSAYLSFRATSLGERVTLADCAEATTGTEVSPCLRGSTLQAALTAGIASASDGVTWTLADGTLRSVGGLPGWVARTPRPLSSTLSGTPQYRVYVQRGNDIWTGSLIADGAAVWGSFVVSNPNPALPVEQRLTLLPYHVRLNGPAADSLAQASAL